jgi:type IV pilus assembly protein PilP
MKRLLIIPCAALAFACGEDVAPPPATVVPVPVPAAAAPAPAAAVAANADLAAANAAPLPGYSPVGKRDPFRSHLLDLVEAQLPKDDRRKQATEEFELDQYRLTGLVTGTSQPVAMVEAPDGVGYSLHIGSRLGKNNGRVTRIFDRGIVIVEEYRDPSARIVRVPITINLPKEEIDMGLQQ